MDQMPMPGGAPQEQAQPGGASKLVADIHSSMMKLLDMVQAKFPEDGQKLAEIVQAYQGFVDTLGSGEAPAGPARPANVPVEAGAAKVSPKM